MTIQWFSIETVPPRTPVIVYFPSTGEVQAAWFFTDHEGSLVCTLDDDPYVGQCSHWAYLNLPAVTP